MMLFQSPARPAMCRASTAHVRPSSTGFTGCGKSRIQAVFSSTGTLACAVLLELTSMHSQEWLCYSTSSATCSACVVLTLFFALGFDFDFDLNIVRRIRTQPIQKN